MKLSELVRKISEVYPESNAESWDNVGLQIGEPDSNIEVNKILIALDFEKAAQKAAFSFDANLVISHHPLLFHSQKKFAANSEARKIAYECIKQNVAVYSVHTNFDSSEHGFRKWISEKFELKKCKPIECAEVEGNELCKLIVYVPEDHVDIVSEKIFEAGAGKIGNYSDCSFRALGEGTFKALDGANPFIGKIDELQRVREQKLEVVLSKKNIRKIISAMKQAHPYEEVAYEIYPMVNRNERIGLGIVGVLDKKITISELLLKIKTIFGTNAIRYGGKEISSFSKLAFLPGSGASHISKAASAGADVFITSDVKYHDWQQASEVGITLIDIPHNIFENSFVDIVSDVIHKIRTDIKIQTFINKENLFKDGNQQ